MTALASYVPSTFQQGENRAVTVGIQPDSSEGDPYQRMQERLDRAAKSEDRDAIYADYAVALTGDGDPRARDLVDKIENTELRKNVKAYTDFQLVQLAIRNKDAAEVARLVKSGELTSIQKVWAPDERCETGIARSVRVRQTCSTKHWPKVVASVAAIRIGPGH